MKTLLLGLGLLCLNVAGFSQQIARSLTAANGTFIGFYEYKPVDYSANPGKKYPLIIFLHGIGERGNRRCRHRSTRTSPCSMCHCEAPKPAPAGDRESRSDLGR